MGDSDFDFNEWLGYGLAGGMFNFGVGPFADIQDLSYEDAIKVANDLYSVALQDGEISKEAGRQAIEKLSFVDYFLGLLKDGGEDVFGIIIYEDETGYVAEGTEPTAADLVMPAAVSVS